MSIASTNLMPGQYVTLSSLQHPDYYTTRRGGGYNMTSNTAAPNSVENTVGKISQVFVAQGHKYYQVVWLPGSSTPKTSFYHDYELTPLTQQQAATMVQQLNTGVLKP